MRLDFGICIAHILPGMCGAHKREQLWLLKMNLFWLKTFAFPVLLLQRQRPLPFIFCFDSMKTKAFEMWRALCSRLLAAKQLLTAALIPDLCSFRTAAGHHNGLWDMPSSCGAKHPARHQEFGRDGPFPSGRRSWFSRAEYPHWRADQGLAEWGIVVKHR